MKSKSKLLFFIFFFCYKLLLAQNASLIYKNTVNSTVTIETDIGLGSGFFIGKNIIATNYHVIEGASQAYCFLNNSNTRYKIEGYLAADKSVDLILLKVEELDKNPIKFATTNVIPGQKLFVIGSPKGLPATISDGIVSGLRELEGYNYIQMTAPISPGSSGGPVLNQNGELVGVSVMQLKDGQNLNFAIPKKYLETLIFYKKDIPLSITSLYVSNSKKQSHEINYYEKDKTYELGLTKKGAHHLILDYMANFEDNTCFYFTYDMTKSEVMYNTIFMEDYRLVDLETGEIYYGKMTDLPNKDNQRVIYRGTKSRFMVCFDRLPPNVKLFSLMEGECSETSFCFLNLDLNNFETVNNVDWSVYKNNENEGTISFYVNQSIGNIDIYVEDYFVGTLTQYFVNQNYEPSCGDVGGAILTLRLPAGTYKYMAKSTYFTWANYFTITKNCCIPFHLTR